MKDWKDLDESIASIFIEAINKENAPWQKPWKAGEYNDPINPITGTIYSGVNNLSLSVIMARNATNDPRFMTFVNARENGYRIKEGSKGIPIIYAGTIYKDKNTKTTIKEEEYQKCNKDDIISIPTRKVHFVFHASQIKGIDEYNINEKNNMIYDNKDVEKLIRNSNAKIVYDQADRSFYRPSTDDIHLLPKANYHSEGDYYSTLLHEMAHWTGHESRLNRKDKYDDIKGFGSKNYAFEELCAEIGSYMICKNLNIDFNPQNSTTYVAGWSKVLQDAPAAIYEATHKGKEIMEYCNNFVNKQELKQENTIKPVKSAKI